MPKPFFITTAIDYTNSAPHIGHAYEKVLADVIARYHRLKGEKVFFLTGVDQHGQKVQQSAAKAGIPPSEFVKGITQRFVDLWKKLDVKYDAWAETIDPRQKKVVQRMLQRSLGETPIYKDKQADPTASSARNGARSNFAKKKIIISNSASTKSGCFATSTIAKTPSFPISARPNCVTPSRN